jgi:hypothetical protein
MRTQALSFDARAVGTELGFEGGVETFGNTQRGKYIPPLRLRVRWEKEGGQFAIWYQRTLLCTSDSLLISEQICQTEVKTCPLGSRRPWLEWPR